MKSRILIIPDVPNWAYHNIAKELIRNLPEYDFEIKFADAIDEINKNHKNWDLIFSMGWRWGRGDIKTPKEKTISTIHSERTLTQGRQINPYLYVLDRYKAIGTVNEKLYHMFLDKLKKDVFYTPNGVNTDIFHPKLLQDLRRTLRIGWVGKLSQANFRGMPIIRKAISKVDNVELRILDAEQDMQSYYQMPKFYNELNIYINASESEGCSLTILEAASCGLLIIATDTGVVPQLIKDGFDGYIIKRDADDIAKKLSRLDFLVCNVMGLRMRNKILNKWSWQKRAQGYKKLIERGLN